MPPNKGSGSILDQYKCNYKQVANPYSEQKHACYEKCPESSESGGSREHDAPERMVEDTLRGDRPRRARQTFELYNYSKNAMMIITSGLDDYVGSLLVNEMKKTFKDLRFDVEVAITSTNAVLYGTCRQFFKRDFTDYGAVALVIMTPMGINEELLAGTGYFEESVIIENFKLERNPTLANKPKIYITEASRGVIGPLYDHLQVIDHATHGDVIGFHVPIAFDTVRARSFIEENINCKKGLFDTPLMTFCKKLAAMADNNTLTEIIAQTIKDSAEMFPVFSPKLFNCAPFGVTNTLSKELYFARLEEDQ